MNTIVGTPLARYHIGRKYSGFTPFGTTAVVASGAIVRKSAASAEVTNTDTRARAATARSYRRRRSASSR